MTTFLFWVNYHFNNNLLRLDNCVFYAQWSEAVNEVQLLMEKMRRVQQLGEEFTQEEMVTRFERERTESLLEPADGMNTLTLWKVE